MGQGRLMAEKKATVKVKPGDSMSAIAAKAGVSLAAMKAANPQVANPSLIKPNQVLNIPAAKPATPAKTTAAPIFNNDPATIALQRLTSGGTLTPEQRTLLGLGNPSTSTSSTSTSTSSTSTSTSTSSTSATTSEVIDGDVVVGTYTDPETGDIFQVWKSGKQTLLKKGTKAADDAAAAAKARYDAEQAALALAAANAAEKRDAFALVQDTMRSYGFTDAELSELSGYIQSAIIDPNLGPNAAILGMRNLGVYKQRFAGNEARVKAGLNALSEGEYLQQEKDYGQYFKEYGVQNLATRAQMATLIGNDVSAIEAKNRIGLAVDRVKNADPNIMKELKTYYPTLGDADLVSYFLNPVQALPELKRKVTASEIGAAAIGQGFKGATDALGLADYGVDRAAALAGYADIKSVLPTSEKLSDIYGEAGIDYTQQTGEAEFLKQNQDAAEKRKRLKSMERASFMGSTGMTGNAGLAQSTQGRF
jgi:murein DD-endopeptidase MepM/ murein hydrolase activator NlpD